jgi:hypothetical protein
MNKYTESLGYQKNRKKIMLAVSIDTLARLEKVKPDNLTVQECIRQMIEWGLESGEELL